MKGIQEDITMYFFGDKNPKNGHSALFVSCSHILTRSICCLLFAFFDLATQIFMVAYTSHLSFCLPMCSIAGRQAAPQYPYRRGFTMFSHSIVEIVKKTLLKFLFSEISDLFY